MLLKKILLLIIYASNFCYDVKRVMENIEDFIYPENVTKINQSTLKREENVQMLLKTFSKHCSRVTPMSLLEILLGRKNPPFHR